MKLTNQNVRLILIAVFTIVPAVDWYFNAMWRAAHWEYGVVMGANLAWYLSDRWSSAAGWKEIAANWESSARLAMRILDAQKEELAALRRIVSVNSNGRDTDG